MGSMRMACCRRRIRVVEEDVIAFNVKERVLLFTRNVLDLVKNYREYNKPPQDQPYVSCYNFGKLYSAKKRIDLSVDRQHDIYWALASVQKGRNPAFSSVSHHVRYSANDLFQM